MHTNKRDRYATLGQNESDDVGSTVYTNTEAKQVEPSCTDSYDRSVARNNDVRKRVDEKGSTKSIGGA